MATRDAVSALGSAAASNTLVVTFTGTQPVAGDKIACVFWASFGTTPSITSVKDNATSQNTYTGSVSDVTANTQGVYLYWLDLPANATWSGNYAITVTFGTATPSESDGGGIAYSGVATGAPTATNHGASNSAAASSGSINPSGSGVYVGGMTDNTASNPATLTAGGGFTNRVTQTNGSAQQAGAMADIAEGSGSKAASWTIDSSNWDALVAFWPDAPAGGMAAGPIKPGQTWR